MKLTIEENKEAEQLIPPTAPDGSGIGVNYVDAYIKPLNTESEGLKVTCKRKGLKIILGVGAETGEAIIRKNDHGPDVRDMLRKALETSATQIGCKLTIADGVICIEA